MTDSTNETVEAPKEQSAVELKQQEIDAKRAELAALQTENSTASVTAEDAIQLEKLAKEEARIDVELAYQRRLKEARDAQTASGLVSGEVTSPAVVVEPGVPGTSTSVPVAPAPPEVNENAEAPAKASGKGK